MSEKPTLGAFRGREHHYPIRVFYEDTDYADNSIMLIYMRKTF